VAEIVASHADEEVLDENGRVDPKRARPLAYSSQQKYWSVGMDIGTYGISRKN